ncbi:MAG: YqaJ viral recombinase family protein, partial [Gammaproteobacteria bacterium]|nr:YqaJ viral recombinase family protein [Gammaproteobacteria bacterium]
SMRLVASPFVLGFFDGKDVAHLCGCIANFQSGNKITNFIPGAMTDPGPFVGMQLTVDPSSIPPPPPPLEGKPMEERITSQDFVARLSVTQEKAKQIEEYEQKSDEWLDARKGRMTASNFGAAIGLNKYQSRQALVKNMLWRKFKGNKATEWGCVNESVAFETYRQTKQEEVDNNLERLDNDLSITDEEKDMMIVDVQLSETGLVINPDRPWMGNSPDGLIDLTYASGRKERGLLEIKCPYSKRFYKEGVPIYYYCQIQGTMGNIGFPWCDFVVWTPQETQITRVGFDQEFWTGTLLPGLEDFYFNMYVPAAVNQENGLLRDGETEVTM